MVWLYYIAGLVTLPAVVIAAAVIFSISYKPPKPRRAHFPAFTRKRS